MTAVVEPSSIKPAPSDPSASAAPARVRIAEPALHHIVIVGGGAAGPRTTTPSPLSWWSGQQGSKGQMLYGILTALRQAEAINWS